jgi:hypothetical protein
VGVTYPAFHIFPGGFFVKRYRPSGRIPFGGLIGLILATIIGSLVIGGLVFAVSHVIYLIVLFPFVMGALGGGLLSLVVKSSKVRSPFIAGLFGLILGVGIIGVNRFAEYYIDFRNEVTSVVRAEDGGEDVSQEEIDQFIDEVLEEEVGSSGFIGYIKYSATLGTTISRTSSEVTLDENATWVYWGVELLIVALFCAGLAFNSARQPFNEDVGEWYPDPFYVGTINWKSRKNFLDQVKNGDTNEVFKMISQNTQAARNPVIEKPTWSFSIGDFISLASAIVMAIAFVALPWLTVSRDSLTGVQLLTEGQSDAPVAIFILLAIVLGGIAGLLGLAVVGARGGARVIALIGGVLGLVYYVFFFIENGDRVANLPEVVGIGFWIALAANVALFIQAFIPRSGSAAASAARLDLVAYQTPTAPNSDVVLGLNNITLNRNQEVSSSVMKVLLTPQEFSDLNRMLNSGQNPSPSGVQLSGLNSLE